MNTAIDFYSRGKEKEAEAKDYSTSNWYPRNRFICPECGEGVFLAKSKYKNIFKHFKRTAQTPECERRIDSVPSESINERIGLPLYLQESSVGVFKLYMGFHALSEIELNQAERDQCEIWVNERLKYRINHERFSSSHSYWMPIDFAPYDEYYKVSYIGKQSNMKVFKKNWGEYAEAFMRYGALFKAENGSGKKLHKGDSIATDTEYYLATLDESYLYKLRGIQFESCGDLVLSNCIFSIFRVLFRSDISDYDFNNLSYFLLKELKLHLLEKAAELFPIWPPIVKQGDRYIAHRSAQHVFGVVESGNVIPSVYGYYENDPVPENFSIRTESIVIIPIKQQHQYFTVDRKNVSTGLIIEKGDLSVDECCLDRFLSINGEEVNYPDALKHNEKITLIEAVPAIDVVVKRKKNVEYFKNMTECEIKAISSSDIIYVFNNTEFLLLIQIEKHKGTIKELIDSEEFKSLLLKYDHTYKISVPLEIRKKLLKHYPQSQLVNKILAEGKIPLAVLQYVERYKDV